MGCGVKAPQPMSFNKEREDLWIEMMGRVDCDARDILRKTFGMTANRLSDGRIGYWQGTLRKNMGVNNAWG